MIMSVRQCREMENLMGYYTSVTGEIRIEPPIPWGEIRESGFLSGGESEAVLVVEENKQETREGTLIQRQATAIAACSEDSFKAYHLIEHVQAIINRYSNGHTFNGRFECFGEDNADIWRLEIHEGKAVQVKPRIVWPDEEATER